MSAISCKQIYWSASRDRDGNREYTVKFMVTTSNKWDGPNIVSRASGLPARGSWWGSPYVYSSTLERDLWARCTPYLSVTPYGQKNNEGVYYWIVENKFSSNPILRCQDTEVGNPLTEPAKISGGFSRHSEEILEGWNETFDEKIPLKSSSHEPLRGPKMEFETSYPTITIEQNLDNSQFDIVKLSELQNCVNEGEMWGLDARTVKLAHSSWTMQYWATQDLYQCSFPYYTRSCTFEINFDGWDRQVDDEGTRALGYWDPRESGDDGVWITQGNKNNVRDFNRYRDKNGEIDHILLNGSGVPLEDGADHVKIDVRGYEQADLFQLWLPDVLSDPVNIKKT